MSTLRNHLDSLVTGATARYEPPSAEDIAISGRRRRARKQARRRVAAGGLAVIVIAAVILGVTLSNGSSPARVTSKLPLPTTSPPVVGAPAGPPPLSAIAESAVRAAGTVPGPPVAIGEVVGSTTSVARGIIDESRRAGGPPAAHAQAPPVPIWLVLLKRHQACSPGCIQASPPPTDYVAVFLRATDLHSIGVFNLKAEGANLAQAGPVFPLLLPGQTVPASQPTVPVTVVPAATVEAADAAEEGCQVPPHLTGIRDALSPAPGKADCTSVSIRLFPDWNALAGAVPGVVEPGLAVSQPSRPLYYVTEWGRFFFAPKTPMVTAHESYIGYTNGIYDAITGQGEGGGTAGEPLP